MSIKAANKLTPFWYTPRSELDAPDPKTRFQLRPMTEMQRMETAEIWSSGRPDANTRCKETVLRFGLIGWENFRDDAGDVAFLSDQNTNIARLSSGELINELSQEIWDSSTIAEEERKN